MATLGLDEARAACEAAQRAYEAAREKLVAAREHLEDEEGAAASWYSEGAVADATKAFLKASDAAESLSLVLEAAEQALFEVEQALR